MKKLSSILLTVAVATSVMCTPVFAETFNGGDVYHSAQGDIGTIKLDLTNIVSQANVKMDTDELLTYLDDEKTANDVIYTDEDGKGFSINSIVEDLNNKDGVPVYYANAMPVITAEKPLTAFMSFWKGDDADKATFIPKYWSFNDYLANEDNAQVYTTTPDGDYLFAPNTVQQINKTGRYLFVVHDAGFISNSPLSIICVNVEETPTTNDDTSN
jgi:hypothetical protein